MIEDEEKPVMEMIVSSCETGDHDWEPVQVPETWLWIRFCMDCGGVDVDYICSQVYSYLEQNRREMRHLSVYRCGIGYDFYNARLTIRNKHGIRAAVRVLKRSWERMRRDIRNRHWHALRMQLKGWMAEPYADSGVTWDTCGSGWTRKGAVKSFHRRQAKHWLWHHYTEKNEIKRRFNLNDDECLDCKVSDNR